MKRIKWYFLFAIIFCSSLSLAQNKSSNQSNRSCKEAIQLLREKYRNDSVAVEAFKAYYDILNMSTSIKDSIFSKQYKEVILYFNSEQGKNFKCRSRIIEIDPRKDYHLLINSSKRKK